MGRTLRFALALSILLSICNAASGADAGYEQSIGRFLHENFDHGDVGMVVALVDSDSTRVFSAGKLGNGTDKLVDADTIFEIGSCTKTFTALLLQEMAHRGEVKLDDPVAKCLPASVKVPSRNGKQITLANLAAQDSGLPFNATNHKGGNWYERFASYTVSDMYEFLSSYTLTQDPGAAYQYSNIGMGVLGHAVSPKAGKDYESLVRERICEPLHMDNTFVNVPPEMKSRMARGHDDRLKPTPDLEIPALAGAGALRSTINDLVKYVSANVGLTPSELTPLMHDMQMIRHYGTSYEWGNTAMPWMDQTAYNPPGSELLGHGGGTGGFAAFIGFDKLQHRGIVILSNQERIHSSILGWRILQHASLEHLDAVKVQAIHEVSGTGIIIELDKKTKALLANGARPGSPAVRLNLPMGTVIEAIDGVPTTGKDLVQCG
ncbi:MAG TPA: serine hydrolase, partial [Tepidisphaeraceae bacterium]|nr:serine hydrolase [Tepidisphaeraceae bacterium]